MKNRHLLLILATFIVGVMVMLPSVFASEFDNVKKYNSISKEVTITNSFGLGSDLMKVKLIENTENCGGQIECYAILEINNYNKVALSDKYSSTFNWEFNDIQQRTKSINHKFYIATSTYEASDEGIYYTDNCKENILKNGTVEKYDCETYTLNKNYYDWKPFDFKNNELPVGKYWIKLVGDKGANEEIDWIPTLLGVKIDEWAWWMSVEPTHYWKFNNGSGNAIDVITTNQVNLTNTNMDYRVGKLNNATQSTANDDNFLGTTTDLRFGAGNFTVVFWVNASTATTEQGIVGNSNSYNTPGEWVVFTNWVGDGKLHFRVNATDHIMSTSNIMSAWHRIVIRRIDGNVTSFIDGVAEASYIETTNFNAGNNVIVGQQDYTNGPTQGDFQGQLDDLAIYKTYAWSNAEIVADYNSGIGRELDYNEVLTTYVSLYSPVNYQNTTQTLVNFNVNASSIAGTLTNVTLYLYNATGTIKTNITTISGSPTSISNNISLSNINVGTYTWNALYCSANATATNCSYDSTNRTITIERLLWGICNSTLNTPYLNITFQDQDDLTMINASIPSSSWTYWAGNQSINYTYSFSEGSNNASYAFCASPSNETLYVIPNLNYKQGTSYPQRNWNPTYQTYNNTATNEILQLLSVGSGIYVTFQVVNSADQLLSSVNAIAKRASDNLTVASGTTGDDGTVTFWLNPDVSHNITFSKEGFSNYSITITPTQSSYTITMVGGGVTPSPDYTRGIQTYITPSQNELFNDTEYTFTFNVTSSYWDLDSFGFILRLANGTTIGTGNSTVSGTAASDSYDVNNQSIVYMDYYWAINGTELIGTKYWIITNTDLTGWSIKTFFTDAILYIDSGIFGLDSFGKNIIIFLILFISVGIFSYKFGLTSPTSIISLIFGIVFFFDIILGLISPIRGIDHLLTYVSGVLLIGVIVQEMAR